MNNSSQIFSENTLWELESLDIRPDMSVLGEILSRTPYTVIFQESGCNFFKVDADKKGIYRIVAGPPLGEHQYNEAEARARLIIFLAKNNLISINIKKHTTWCNECEDRFISKGDLSSILKTGKCIYCFKQTTGICVSCGEMAGFGRTICRKCELNNSKETL